jgi:hypothetical protein
MTIYSPDLRSTEQELVNLLNDRDRGTTSRASNDQLIEASKRRLKLWNVSDQEITELEKRRKPSDQWRRWPGKRSSGGSMRLANGRWSTGYCAL